MNLKSAKKAVQTSILSKRWKNLWSSLPDLDFDFKLFASLNNVDLSWPHQNRRLMLRFTDYVSHFLSRRDDTSSIREFKLKSCELASTYSTFVEKCLDYAINHGVQTLDIDAYCYPTPFEFPVNLFRVKSLTILRLKQYSNSVVILKPFILPNLKTLYLERFHFDGNIYSFSKEPFSSLPNLEELTLHRCELLGLTISASKLRILEISFEYPLFSFEAKMEKISAPSLTSFRYEGYVPLVCPKVDFPCLEEVYVDNFANVQLPYRDGIEPLNLMKMLQQLENAKFVALTLGTIQVLATDANLLEQSPSPFPHMRKLKLIRRPCMIHPIDIVPLNVMNYLTNGSSFGESLVVEFPQGIEG
ncbi:hypothetical protein BUALT_Bualt08G0123000 [Buddleja alternifolia]|uniref:Uncharacterized protein n=1 Tax=Buddleja alternifolia TaxID=168488 RepID=A0AAV6X5U0_9LAMI|nr:hypothetical protein BUALT_Bualt08G0123000 [Buddleja alternifolia]